MARVSELVDHDLDQDEDERFDAPELRVAAAPFWRVINEKNQPESHTEKQQRLMDEKR